MGLAVSQRATSVVLPLPPRKFLTLWNLSARWVARMSRKLVPPLQAFSGCELGAWRLPPAA